MATLKIGGKTYNGNTKTIARLSGKSESEVEQALSQPISKQTSGATTLGGAAALGGLNLKTSTTPNNSGGNSQYTNNGYTIGSDYGKQQAQNMDFNTPWTATDGSIWTKENDGTITVYHNGMTYHNAYKPTDLGILGGQQVDAGVNYRDVEQTLYDRLNKIANNPELSQYANDGAYWKMYNYIQDQKKKEEYENNLDQFNQNRPEDYQSKYDPQIDALLNEILNRDDFSYDVANDPLYQQYANMYRREGDRAMRETMAEAAAGAGGMNTYAVTAAQQANNYYNSQLNDKIPELYQLAYDMYLRDKESKVQDLGLLQNMDATQYGRYRDTMSDFKDDRNFALGLYNDAVAQGNWNKNFDFNAMVDNRNFGYSDLWTNKEWNYNDEWKNKEWDYNDEWKNKEWNEAQSDKEYERDFAEREEAKATIEWYIGNGVSADAIPKDLIEQSGLDATAISQMVDYFKQQQAPKGTSSGGGSGGSGGSGYTGKGGGDEKKKGEGDDYGYTGGGNGGDGTIPQSELAGIMTQDEWERRKSSHEVYGQGNVAVSEYDTYEEYRNAMMDYLKQKYSNG